LRGKYPDLLLNGTMCDTDGFELDSPELNASAFISNNRMAVLITQSHLNSVTCELKVPGYQYETFDCLGNPQVEVSSDSIKTTIGKHDLAVFIFKKRNQMP